MFLRLEEQRCQLQVLQDALVAAEDRNQMLQHTADTLAAQLSRRSGRGGGIEGKRSAGADGTVIIAANAATCAATDAAATTGTSAADIVADAAVAAAASAAVDRESNGDICRDYDNGR